MTVADLIDRLKRMDPGAVVVYRGNEDDDGRPVLNIRDMGVRGSARNVELLFD